MVYTEHNLKIALRSLPLDPPRWVWDPHPHVLTGATLGTTVRSVMLKMRPMARFRFELWRYCWGIYHLTSTDTGHQVLGREWDTDSFSPSTGHEKWARVNGKWTEVVRRAGVNLDPGARGNALKMDKWHPIMNDCWLLGGVHRLATFRLVSMRHAGNIWNFGGGRMVVTARELLGLRRFGYAPEHGPSTADIVFKPVNRALALGASLEAYAAILAGPAAQRATMLREMVDPGVNDLMAEIRQNGATRRNRVPTTFA